MLMSATLGARARARWTGGVPPTFEAARKAPYPAVWTADEGDPRTTAHSGRSKTVHMDTIPTMEAREIAKRAVEAARRGARVLVIRNTVSMAVETWRAARDAGAYRATVLDQLGFREFGTYRFDLRAAMRRISGERARPLALPPLTALCT